MRPTLTTIPAQKYVHDQHDIHEVCGSPTTLAIASTADSDHQVFGIASLIH